MMDRSKLIEKLDSLIELGQQVVDLWDENTRIMESHHNVTVPLNHREQGRSTR